MDENIDDLENLKFIALKSKDLLQEQLKSYESANTKAGVLISVSSLFIPIAVTLISNSDLLIIFKYLTILPIFLMIVALTFLLRVLTHKKLKHGLKFEAFEDQLKKSHKDLLAYEIGAYTSSYQENDKIVTKQTENYNAGIKLIYLSSILIFTIVTISMFFSNTEIKDKKIDKIIIEQFNIN